MAQKTKGIVRVTVLVKAGTKANPNLYSYMSSTTAKIFGFTLAKSNNGTSKKKSKLGKTLTYSFRGSQGAGSIKVPVGGGTKTTKGKAPLMKSIPMPLGMKITDIQKFLQKATKNKPDRFVSRGGRTYPVSPGKTT